MKRAQDRFYEWEREVIKGSALNGELQPSQVPAYLRVLRDALPVGKKISMPSVHFYKRKMGRVGYACEGDLGWEIHLNAVTGSVKESSVAHEFAHVVTESMRPGTNHSSFFVRILCRLYAKCLVMDERSLLQSAGRLGLLGQSLDSGLATFRGSRNKNQRSVVLVDQNELNEFIAKLESFQVEERRDLAYRCVHDTLESVVVVKTSKNLTRESLGFKPDEINGEIVGYLEKNGDHWRGEIVDTLLEDFEAAYPLEPNEFVPKAASIGNTI